MSMEYISSVQNQRIKRVVLLQQKSSERRKEGLFVVEGRREILHCLEAGYVMDSAFCCLSLTDNGDAPEDFQSFLERLSCPVYSVSPPVYDKIAYRGGTEGILAVVRMKTLSLDDLSLSENPLLMVVESVEKPGNLGAILRSADASAADAVIVCDPLTDLFNPNLIRSSVGAVFSVPCVACTSEECISFLKQKGIQILTAQLQDSSFYYDIDMCKPTAFIMGTEATGLTDKWRSAADAHIRIPMLGRLDSLNVSVSAAILLYEAVRQRQAHGLCRE